MNAARPGVGALLLVCWFFVILQEARAQAGEVKRILIVNEAGVAFPGIDMINRSIREELEKSPYKLEFYGEYLETVLVGLLSDEDNSSGFDRSVFNETFRKPFDVALLAERIRTLVGRRKQLA